MLNKKIACCSYHLIHFQATRLVQCGKMGNVLQREGTS